MNESTARRVVLVQAFDAADSPLWTREDGQWASRLAVETLPATASPQRWVAERARHALERLQPRDRGVARWLARAGWRPGWLLWAMAAGVVAGLLGDLVGQQAHIDLLAPAVWAVLGWNLIVLAWLLVAALRGAGEGFGGPPGWFRRLLAAAWQRGTGTGPLREASHRWAGLTARLTAARVAGVVHLASASLGAGLAAGMYLRGLVFDFRAGWQSTFLDATTVHTLLNLLLWPAQALTGIGLPDVATLEAIRLTPAAPLAQASAAPWIHLYAAMLVLGVVLPRGVLAGVSFGRALWLSWRVELPLDAALLSQLGRWKRVGAARVQVFPYAQTPGPQAALALRELLAGELGADLQLSLSPATAVGDEEAVARLAATGSAVEPGEVALRIALVDLGATPEDEQQGRFLRALAALRPAAALLLVADESAFVRRFGNLPGRVDERRAGWRSFAQAQGLRFVSVAFEEAARPESAAALKQALDGGSGAPGHAAPR
jgi:hypothetical protein